MRRPTPSPIGSLTPTSGGPNCTTRERSCTRTVSTASMRTSSTRTASRSGINTITSVLKGTIVDANIRGIVIKVEDAYYHMRLNDFLDDVLNPPVDKTTRIAAIPSANRLRSTRAATGRGRPRPVGATGAKSRPDLLKVVKLAKSVDSGRRWEVEFTDALRKKEYTCTPDFESRSGFEVKDRQGTAVRQGPGRRCELARRRHQG